MNNRTFRDGHAGSNEGQSRVSRLKFKTLFSCEQSENQLEPSASNETSVTLVIVVGSDHKKSSLV